MYKTNILIGAGAIYPISDGLTAMIELFMKTKFDYTFLSASVDYKLGPGSIRGSAGVDLQIGAPDFMAAVSYALFIG